MIFWTPTAMVFLELCHTFIDGTHHGAIPRAVALRRKIPLFVEPIHHLIF